MGFPGRISSLYGSFTKGSQPGSDSRAHRYDSSRKDCVSASEESRKVGTQNPFPE